ncbi:MAG TPA: ISNCY family transposase [Longimicrobium sp.]|nr:ISNCY family transposase [Longimicrobium sp.]
MWAAWTNRRTLVTLTGLLRLHLSIRRCPHADCPRYRRPYRPEAEGALALPHHEFGLDVIALIGALRYVQHQSVPEMHRTLRERGVDIAERNVTYLLERYDELLALSLSDPDRLREITAREGRVILALDGLQPDVGHEVLWVLRDCLSGEVLLAKSLLSATAEDLGALLRSVADVLPVPIVAVVSDGQLSIRRAVERALPDVPHQLCHFHYLREAALPIYEADRHAKKELKKRVRGIRVLERQVEPRSDAEAEVVRGYCAAVRSALTDDGPPPLSASGLQLHERLSQIRDSLERVEKRGPLPKPLARLKALLGKGLDQTHDLWPDVRVAFAWVHTAARILNNEETLSAPEVQRRLQALLDVMARDRDQAGALASAIDHFLKVSRSYWPGLFHCYSVAGVPRTNNDLEQFFGSSRHHERRATGRKGASPGLVLRGSVRLVAGAATRLRNRSGAELQPRDPARWRQLREQLEARRHVRRRGLRFRRDPKTYLSDLDEQLRKLGLPS